MKATVSSQPLPAKAYVRIGLVGIAVFLLLLFAYSRLIPLFAEYGELYFFRYILLLAFGLVGAIVLFGVIRSSSTISYTEKNWKVKIGGPAAVFFLVVWGGIKYVPNTPQTFDVTIRPESSETNGAIITSGSILVDLDSDRRSQRLSPSGEADFKQVPWRFRGTAVSVRAQVEGYEETPQSIVLSGSVVTLLLIKLPPPVTQLTGSIVLPKQKAGDIKILVEGQNSETSPDKFGRFQLSVDGRPGDRIRVKVFINGNLAYDDFQSLPGPVTINPRLNK